jgi:hypothetical protein
MPPIVDTFTSEFELDSNQILKIVSLKEQFLAIVKFFLNFFHFRANVYYKIVQI